jgi:hypothetical protein
MPGKLSKKDESRWQKAKRVVRKHKGKKQSRFTDRDWGLVQHIFKAQKKADMVSSLRTIASALDSVGEFSMADEFDDILENI